MKKYGKHLASFLLALVMTLALSVSALAAPSDTCTVTFRTYGGAMLAETSGTLVTANKFAGYQLLSLSLSLKDENCHTGSVNGQHTSTCYNYAYTFDKLGADGASKYQDILLSVVNGLQNNAEPKIADLEGLLAYLKEMDDDTTRKFADAVYQKIQEKALAPDTATGGVNYPSLTVKQGYWLFADISTYEPGTTNTVKSLVLLDTAGNPSVTVTPKQDIPTVDKKVSDTDGSGYSDTTDVNIGDTVYFKITGTLPKHLGSYAAYEYVFHDTLSKGLTFNNDVKVTVNGTTDVSTSFTTTASTTGGTTITVSCADILDSTKGFPGSITAPKKDTIVLTYSATLNENAVIGGNGNPNKVYLEYTNDPYAESTGKTPEDEVKVFTFQLNVTKTDGETSANALAGAQFVLLNSEQTQVARITAGKLDGWAAVDDITVNPDGTYPVDYTMTSGSDGKFALAGLDAGTYYLKETKAPEGYNLLKDPIKLVISATYTDTSLTALTIQTDDNTPIDGITSSGIVSITVVNNSGAQLPSTGGVGTTVFYVLGSALVLGAVVLLVTRKRMRDRT